MIRMVLRAAVPLMAALLLDRYCELRAKRQKKEKVTDLTRWEGEGGAVVPSSPRPAA
jgi:hypothetical protein